ncbi:MAG: magnesium protoporphyrin IX methyltransferase [Burkholderiaceae bacterium]
MASTYQTRRGEIETYFDRTASATWAKLTSDAPVSRIRATVRAGRDRMRASLIGSLPEDLSQHRVLDAGCGPGALCIELARRGAQVTGVDLSPTLIDLARERLASEQHAERITLLAGDMTQAHDEPFDYVVAMDSVIHYEAPDLLDVVARLAGQARKGVMFTVAPSTPLLRLMHLSGKLFPRSDRSPAICPISTQRLQQAIEKDPRFTGWQMRVGERVNSRFYISQAVELIKQ